LDLVTFSTEDMLQKYLASQSKLSTLVQKPKQKSCITKKKIKLLYKNNTKRIIEPIEKNINVIEKSTELPKQESGSEYFPSTDSGKRNYQIVKY